MESAAEGGTTPALVLNTWSSIKELHSRLRALGAPIYGTKDVLFRRLCEYEQIAARKKEEEYLESRRKEFAVATEPVTPKILPGPTQPSEVERWYHMVNHLPPATWCELCVMGRGVCDPHFRSDVREKGEQLLVIAFDLAFVKTTSASGETEQNYATTLVAVDADLFFVKVILVLRKETSDYSATGLIKFIEGVFHKHVRLRCDGEPATVALANKVKNMAGDLVKFETTPKHSSASNPAERAIQAVEEQSRTSRADCQMRFGSSETFGADKPIWAWLLRHAGWQISRYKPKGNGTTAYIQACGEHYTHEVVLFAEIVLVRVPKPTHRGLQGGKVERWHKGDAVFIKGVWVGRSDLSDEHVVLTLGGRVFSKTIRRLEPSRRHDAGFLDKVKSLPWDAQDGIVRGRPRKEPAPPPPILVGENTQNCNLDMPDKTEATHSETPKETDDAHVHDSVPMSNTPLNDDRDASHIKSKSSVDTGW